LKQNYYTPQLRKLDLLGDRSRGSPVGVAQDEGHVVPDLVLAATDVQRLAARGVSGPARNATGRSTASSVPNSRRLI